MTDEANQQDAAPPTLAVGPPPLKPAIIGETFRNGSLTAVSVVVGFSLSFLNRWAALPGAWNRGDLVAVLLIIGGIIAQMTALSQMLFVESLLRTRYDRSVRLFLCGLIMVSLGVAVAILGDILGFAQNALKG